MRHEKICVRDNEENGFKAEMYTYIIDNSKAIDENRKRPLVLVCPGGGYEHVSDREAEPIAIKLNALGLHACVLRYSIAPAMYPEALLQLASAMAIVREHAAEWNVDEDRIVVGGFSAGGHLAGCLGTMWHEKWLEDMMGMPSSKYRPNGLLLAYPVITGGEFAHRGSFMNLVGDDEEKIEYLSLENRVNEYVPKTFMWHTFEDGAVPLENSLMFASRLREHGIQFEYHVYERGGHGLSLGTEETANNDGSGIMSDVVNWIDMFARFVKNI